MGHTFSNNVLISLSSSEALGPFLALFFMTFFPSHFFRPEPLSILSVMCILCLQEKRQDDTVTPELGPLWWEQFFP